MQAEIVELIARMIDPPVQLPEEGEYASKREVKRKFAQLPCAVEYALIRCLYERHPGWLRDEPKDDRSVPCTDAHFCPGIEQDYQNAGTYYTGHSYILDFTFSDEYFSERARCLGSSSLNTSSASVDEWMEKHGLFETTEDNPDPHFAERAFIVNVFVPAYGADALSAVNPQNTFEQFSYQVDFLIATPRGCVVVEVDGREYHDPLRIGVDRFEYERRRENDIQSLGYPIFRYPARRILQEPQLVIAELKRHIHSIWNGQIQLFGSPRLPEKPRQEDLKESIDIQLTEGYGKWFRPVQLALLLALSKAAGIERFRIVERNCPCGLLFFALLDLSLLVRQASKLYDLPVSMPRYVELCIPKHAFDSELFQQLTALYSEAISRGPEQFYPLEEFLTFQVKTSTEEDRYSQGCELVVDLEREGRIPLLPEGPAYPDVLGRESANIATLRARLKAMSLRERNEVKPQCLEKRLLDYFARRFLRIPSLYHHYDPSHPNKELRQYELVRRVLQGESVLGIMPTGRGKSVAFQLPAMLLPGGVLVISPLRALMKDQLDDLRYNRGFNSVESIRYDMKREEKDKAVEDFVNGFTNLLYVSPERLQEIKFSSELARAASRVQISFLAIDEAHCVSEWGHDFRLSYLHIPIFLDSLKEMQGGTLCPILALTATATPPVRRDVCSILKLSSRDAREGGNLVAESNIDRTELSFSVHPVEGDWYPVDRQDVLIDVLTRVLPRALGTNHGFSWRDFSNGGWAEKGAGVIFCIYARPQGQTSWQDGVGAVRDSLLAREVIPDENMRLYASQAPRYCPTCFGEGVLTYAIRNVPRGERDEDDTGDGGSLMCCSNGHSFNRAAFNEDWDEQLTETQQAFKANEIPLLVSTKAFGMGIDHRGLRFIVHYGFSSSIESYYQEVGRGGRDGSQAHCALIVRPPHEVCLKNLLEKEHQDEDIALPPCMSGLSFRNRTCPPEIGLPEPCDFSRQLRFVLEYYEKPEGFAEKCAALWADLAVKQPDPEGRIEKYVCGGGVAGAGRLQKTQNYLFRLQQLGLVARFMLRYRPHRNHFDVLFNVWMEHNPSLESMLGSLRSSLIEVWSVPEETPNPMNLSRHEREADSKLEELFDQGPTARKRRLEQDQVESAVLALFSEVRRYVLKMRLRLLSHLINYVKSEDQCRRKELLGAMTGQSDEGFSHACKFCDSNACVPDVAFTQMLATAAPDSGQHQDIFAAEDDALRSEDLDKFEWALTEAEHQGVVGAIGYQAVARLEFDPDNPIANLAAAESYRRNPDRNLRRSAHGFFRECARIANIERKDRVLSKRGYSGYLEFDRSEAIRTFARTDSAFDNKEDMSMMDADAGSSDLTEEERVSLKCIRYSEEFRATVASLLTDTQLQNALSEW